MHDQNDRIHTVSNCILQAISYMPKRPEGYFLMSQFHERSSNWQESYTWAEMGLSLNDDNFVHLPADVGYRLMCPIHHSPPSSFIIRIA